MRKSILSLIFSTLLATMGFTTSSNAIGLEGLGIGFSVGTAGYYAVGQEFDDNPPAGVDGDTKQSGAFQNDVGSVFIEYTAGPVTFGVDYHVEDITTPENTNIQGATTNTVKATFENHTTAYIAVPVWGGLYVKAGGIYVDINTQESLGTGGSYGNADTKGITAGFGYQHDVQDGFSVRFEALAASYDDVTSTNSNNTTTSVKVTDMMGASGRISLLKTF
ncbi:MAG: hypothetical protein H8E55_09575 [Pelagibacterales bacterium]|nr:hypothetical protein [Pelagibacterales bacterium]